MFHLIFLLIMLPLLLIDFWLFDRLVRLEHQFHRREWEKDGKPIGFFWVPSESSVWSGAFARNRCSGAWSFRTPEWMRKDERALRLLFWYRWLGRFWIVGIIALASPVLIALLRDVFK
jgi:hypothetical protein